MYDKTSSSAHGIVTKAVYKTLSGSLIFACLKPDLVQLFIVRSPPDLREKYFITSFCIPPLTFLESMLSIVKDFRLK